MKYDRSLMKENAKAAMALAKPKTWIVTLVFLLLLGVVSGVINALAPDPLGEYIGSLVGTAMEGGSFDSTPPEDLLLGLVGVLGAGAVLSVAAAVLTALFSVLMNYGYRGYALEVYRREPCAGLGSLFKGFPRFGAAVGSAILVGLFSFLWGLLIYSVDAIINFLVIVLCKDLPTGGWVGLIVLFLAAGPLHSIITYRYCLTPYYVMGQGRLGASDAVNASVKAMKGNIFKRFVLELSFLGWKLLLKLIILAVFLCSAVIAAFVSGGGLLNLIDMAERGRYMGPEEVGQFVAALLGVAIPFLVAAAVTVLAQLPMNLWLTAYRNVSCAGFFQEITGGVAQASGMMPPPPYAPSGFNNVQPPVPGGPSMPEAVSAPVAAPYTPFGGQTGAAPQAVPYVPFGAQAGATQLPEEPQAPDAPADPEPTDPEN